MMMIATTRRSLSLALRHGRSLNGLQHDARVCCLSTYSRAAKQIGLTTTSTRPSLAMGPRQKRLEATAVFNNNSNDHQHHHQRESDLVVVLDMDECLIHSQFLSPQAAKYAHQIQQQQKSSATDENQNRVVDSFHVTLPDGDAVHVYQRPHLYEFLRAVSQKYETHVFTAAMEIYAKPVLDHLDPLQQIFSQRWYRDSCTLSEDGGSYVKDLTILEKDQSRVVLVDNNPLSFIANPSNGILVSSFYDDPQDTSLLAVLSLLEDLDQQEDVRPLLDQKFGLKAALRDLE